MLTEGSVRAADKRVRFIGIESYVAAGGTVMRDLFQGDDGGWLQDVALLERMVADRLKAESEEIARAGAFVSIAQDGTLRAERGYVRPEDELPVEPEPTETERTMAADVEGMDTISAEADAPMPEPEEEDGLTPISDRLMSELTAHRTLGLRQALGEHPDVAFLAALHALALKVFYHYGSDSCLELELKSVAFGNQAPGLNDSAVAEAIRTRHDGWAQLLPKEPDDLWDTLRGWDSGRRSVLFAHVVSLSVNAVNETWNRRPRALAHADRLAQAVGLDMAAAGWRPTVDTFLGRVTKARILQAVAEAKGQRAADRIEHLKKGDMAAEAETLLTGTGWLPEPLRTPNPVTEQVAGNDTDTGETGGTSSPVAAE